MSATMSMIPREYRGHQIHQRVTDGYCNATAMARATSGRLDNYFRSPQTAAFLSELASSLNLREEELVLKLGGSHTGTWVHPRVAINLAQWLSPEFAVAVTGWVFELLSTGRVELERPAGRKALGVYSRRIREAWRMMTAVPPGHWTIFHKCSELLIHVEFALDEAGVDMDEFDLLDGSIGAAWPKYRAGQPWAAGERVRYPHTFPDKRGTREAWAYPAAEMPHFDHWLTHVYPLYHLGRYLAGKYPTELLLPALAALRARGLDVRHDLLGVRG